MFFPISPYILSSKMKKKWEETTGDGFPTDIPTLLNRIAKGTTNEIGN